MKRSLSIPESKSVSVFPKDLINEKCGQVDFKVSQNTPQKKTVSGFMLGLTRKDNPDGAEICNTTRQRKLRFSSPNVFVENLEIDKPKSSSFCLNSSLIETKGVEGANFEESVIEHVNSSGEFTLRKAASTPELNFRSIPPKKSKIEKITIEAIASDPNIDLTLGDPADQFIIVDSMNRGNKGILFTANNIFTSETVALKKLLLSQSSYKQAISEVSILSRSKNENIVEVIAVYVKDDFLWLFMQYYPFGSVLNLLEKLDTITENIILLIVFQLLVGLEYLHSNGIVHRDLKLANLLLSDCAILKIADFGISCYYLGEESEYTISEKEVTGSAHWMPPESVLSDIKPDPSSDIWAVGIILIELCDKVPPYFDINPISALYRIVEDEPPTLLSPSLWSDELNDFIALCLKKDPRQRPSIGDLMEHPFITTKPIEPSYLLEICQERGDKSSITRMKGRRSERRNQVQKTKPKLDVMRIFIPNRSVSLITIEKDMTIEMVVKRAISGAPSSEHSSCIFKSQKKQIVSVTQPPKRNEFRRSRVTYHTRESTRNLKITSHYKNDKYNDNIDHNGNNDNDNSNNNNNNKAVDDNNNNIDNDGNDDDESDDGDDNKSNRNLSDKTKKHYGKAEFDKCDDKSDYSDNINSGTTKAEPRSPDISYCEDIYDFGNPQVSSKMFLKSNKNSMRSQLSHSEVSLSDQPSKYYQLVLSSSTDYKVLDEKLLAETVLKEKREFNIYASRNTSVQSLFKQDNDTCFRVVPRRPSTKKMNDFWQIVYDIRARVQIYDFRDIEEGLSSSLCKSLELFLSNPPLTVSHCLLRLANDTSAKNQKIINMFCFMLNKANVLPQFVFEVIRFEAVTSNNIDSFLRFESLGAPLITELVKLKCTGWLKLVTVPILPFVVSLANPIELDQAKCDPRHRKQNQKIIGNLLSALVSSVLENLEIFPIQLQILSFNIDMLLGRFLELPHSHWAFQLILFEHCLFPALLNPSEFGIGFEISPFGRRALVILAKALIAVRANKPFTTDFMNKLNPYVKSLHLEVKKALDELFKISVKDRKKNTFREQNPSKEVDMKILLNFLKNNENVIKGQIG